MNDPGRPVDELAGERPRASSLQLYLDGEGPEFLRDEVERWIEQCPETRAEFELLQAISLGLRDLPDLTAPPTLRETVMARVADRTRDAEPPVRAEVVAPLPTASRWTGAIAASFLMLLMVGVWWTLDRWDGRDEIAMMETAGESSATRSAKHEIDGAPAGEAEGRSSGSIAVDDVRVDRTSSPVRIGTPSEIPTDGMRTRVYTLAVAEDDTEAWRRAHTLLVELAGGRVKDRESGDFAPFLGALSKRSLRASKIERDVLNAYGSLWVEVTLDARSRESLHQFETAVHASGRRDDEPASAQIAPRPRAASGSRADTEERAGGTTGEMIKKKANAERAARKRAAPTGAPRAADETLDARDREEDVGKADTVRVIIILVRPAGSSPPADKRPPRG